MLIRLKTRDGLDRVQVDDTATMGDLQKKVEETMNVPKADQLFSKDERVLLKTTEDPERYRDFKDASRTLSSYGIKHGDIVCMLYHVERKIATPSVRPNTKAFGAKMTVDDLIAKQTRIERQEKPFCESVSFDRNAANKFQAYIHGTLGFSVKRSGLMYGTVSEEGSVKVEFIYEPPQQGTEDEVILMHNAEEDHRVEHIANILGYRLVGYIISHSNKERDFTMSAHDLGQMAEMHARSGLREFVTAVVLLQGAEDGSAVVHFEAFQCSEQCVKLWQDGWFLSPDPANLKVTKLKKDVIVAGKDVMEVDNDFFLVPVKISDHVGPLGCDFPIENRITHQTKNDLKAHLQAFRSRSYIERISDFHLLLFLSSHLDPTTDMALLVDAVRTRKKVQDGYQLIIDSLAGL